MNRTYAAIHCASTVPGGEKQCRSLIVGATVAVNIVFIVLVRGDA